LGINKEINQEEDLTIIRAQMDIKKISGGSRLFFKFSFVQFMFGL